jgi:predicted transcriptional regulator
VLAKQVFLVALFWHLSVKGGPHMAYKESFARMYQSVIKDKRIIDIDFRVLAYIKSHSDTWRVIQEDVAKALDVSPSTVLRSIDRLEGAGYMTCDRKTTKTGHIRKNVRLSHKPSHWDSIEDTSKPNRKVKSIESKMKGQSRNDDKLRPPPVNTTSVMDDVVSTSSLTHNEELADTSYGQLNTNSYDGQLGSSLVDKDKQALWDAYNNPLPGYEPVGIDDVPKSDIGLVVQMIEDMENTRHGLFGQPGDKDEYGIDDEYHRLSIVDQMKPNSPRLRFPSGYCVCLSGQGAQIFRRPGKSVPSQM